MAKCTREFSSTTQRPRTTANKWQIIVRNIRYTILDIRTNKLTPFIMSAKMIKPSLCAQTYTQNYVVVVAARTYSCNVKNMSLRTLHHVSSVARRITHPECIIANHLFNLFKS